MHRIVFKALVSRKMVSLILYQDSFKSNIPERKFQTITSQSQFEKASGQKSIAEHWTVISNQMIKYQLSHTRFD